MITKVIDNIDLALLETLSVKGCVNVEVVQGDSPFLTVEVDKEDGLDALSIYRKGNQLEIGYAVTHVTIIKKNPKNTTVIQYYEDSGINVAGNVYVYGTNNGNVAGGDIHFKDIFGKQPLPEHNEISTLPSITLTLPYALNTIKASGGSFVHILGVFKELTLTAKGQSDIKATGQVEQLKVVCSGQSDIKAKHLEAKEATIIASGQSDAKICVSEMVNAIASGQADIKVHGSPQQVKKLASGQATIKIKKEAK